MRTGWDELKRNTNLTHIKLKLKDKRKMKRNQGNKIYSKWILFNLISCRHATRCTPGYFALTLLLSLERWFKSLLQESSGHPKSKKRKPGWKDAITIGTKLHGTRPNEVTIMIFCGIYYMCSFHVSLYFVPRMPFGVELSLSHQSLCLCCVYTPIQGIGPGGFLNHHGISSRGIHDEMVTV